MENKSNIAVRKIVRRLLSESEFSFGEIPKINKISTMEKLIKTAERDGYINNKEGSAQYIMDAAKQIAKEFDKLQDEEKKILRNSYYQIFLKRIGKNKKTNISEGQEVMVMDMKEEAKGYMIEIKDSLDFASSKLYDLKKMADYIVREYPYLSKSISDMVEPMMHTMEITYPKNMSELLKKFY